MSTQRKAEHLVAYIKALQGHDWDFEWSDDYAVWRSGKDSLQALRMAQELIDQDHMIWNQFAPDDWKSKRILAAAT